MIIVNGTIEVKRKDGGGIDPTTGFPITATGEWGECIPCQYLPTENKQARSMGEAVTRRSYAILLEGHCGCYPCVNEQIRLRDCCGNIIDEFRVISSTPLRAVDQTRLDV